MLGSQHAAPRLTKQVITIVDAQGGEQVLHFVQEEVDGPEVTTLFGQVRRTASAQLVVVHHRSSVLGQLGEGQHVVVRAARPSVGHQQGNFGRRKIAGDAIPRLPLAKGNNTVKYVW